MDPFDFPFEKVKEFYEAYKAFHDIIYDGNFHYKVDLSPGDYLIYNNHQCLHARDAFEGDRHLRGVYMDFETIFQYLTSEK
jgi:gamma-butyrobetaine dioxygenase